MRLDMAIFAISSLIKRLKFQKFHLFNKEWAQNNFEVTKTTARNRDYFQENTKTDFNKSPKIKLCSSRIQIKENAIIFKYAPTLNTRMSAFLALSVSLFSSAS